MNFWKTIILSFASIFIAYPNSGETSEWSYKNPKSWGTDFPQCDGKRQSPIQLVYTETTTLRNKPIEFFNYDATLNASIVNNGHTANIILTPVQKYKRPQITGAKLMGQYEATSLHFHWGSKNSTGSEHLINNRRYDVEMHIVHKNIKYPTLDKALQNKDGLAVLGMMISKSNRPSKSFSGLSTILQKIPEITKYGSETSLDRKLTLDDVLGNMNRQYFFTYNGSLTTPPCSEVVTWIVFAQVLKIKTTLIENLYKLKNSKGQPLLNNYRPLQALGNREVFFHFGN